MTSEMVEIILRIPLESWAELMTMLKVVLVGGPAAGVVAYGVNRTTKSKTGSESK